MTEELKNCPWCAEKPIAHRTSKNNMMQYITNMACACGAVGKTAKGSTKQEAIKAWNTRAGD